MNRIKLLLAVLVSAAVLSSCATSKKITTVSVLEKKESLRFSPDVIENKLDNGLNLEITPISADELNIAFGDLSRMNGQYQFSNVATLRRDFTLNDKGEKDGPIVKMIRGIEDYCSEQKIKKSIVDKLITNVVLKYGDKKDQDILAKLIIRNPYYIDGKYLSVYKLKFINKTNTVKTIKRSDLSIISGNEMLPILSGKDISMIHNNVDDYLLLSRCNLEDEIKIFPHETIVKYVSTAPLNYKNKDLKIYTKGVQYVFNAEHKVTEKKREYKYQRVPIKAKYYSIENLAITLGGREECLSIEKKEILVPDTLKGKIIVFSFFYNYGFLYLTSKEVAVEDLLRKNSVDFNIYEKIDTK